MTPDRTIGRCSICDGDVTLPLAWMGIVPPVPTCRRCGARARCEPVIPMERSSCKPTIPTKTHGGTP